MNEGLMQGGQTMNEKSNNVEARAQLIAIIEELEWLENRSIELEELIVDILLKNNLG